MVALRLFTTTLKNLAVELNAFVLTSTQVSNDDDPKGGFRDFHHVQGSRAIANLVDLACVVSRPTSDELNQVAGFKQSFGFSPNCVTDVFKNRRGRWNMIRIWSYQDLGTCRKTDLFVTSSLMKEVDEFSPMDFNSTEPIGLELEKLYNTGEVTNATINFYESNSDEILDNLSEAFGDREDRLKRLQDKGLDDLI